MNEGSDQRKLEDNSRITRLLIPPRNSEEFCLFPRSAPIEKQFMNRSDVIELAADQRNRVFTWRSNSVHTEKRRFTVSNRISRRGKHNYASRGSPPKKLCRQLTMNNILFSYSRSNSVSQAPLFILRIRCGIISELIFSFPSPLASERFNRREIKTTNETRGGTEITEIDKQDSRRASLGRASIDAETANRSSPIVPRLIPPRPEEIPVSMAISFSWGKIKHVYKHVAAPGLSCCLHRGEVAFVKPISRHSDV